MSKTKPIDKIVKIWVRTLENDFTINKATKTENKAVRVIVIPVLKESKIFLFNDSPSRFKTLDVSKISVSTEYPISIKKATRPAVEISMPRILTTTNVIKISAKAEAITAIDGTNVLKIRKITIPIATNATKIAINNCL